MRKPQPQKAASQLPPLNSPGLFRRLASGFYDALIFMALCMLATLLLVVFQSGQSLQAFYAHHAGVKLLYQTGLVALGYVFFGWFWTHGGQTIGMRTWRLRVVCMDGSPVGWRRALVRYLGMLIPWMLLLLGLELWVQPGGPSGDRFYAIVASVVLASSASAFIWPAFDPGRMAWHDRLSSTCLTLLPSRRG